MKKSTCIALLAIMISCFNISHSVYRTKHNLDVKHPATNCRAQSGFVSGDYNGDGKTDIAYYNATKGTFSLAIADDSIVRSLAKW